MRTPTLILPILALSLAACSSAPHHQAAPAGMNSAGTDGRIVVDFPEPLRTHTLANMRDHLLAIQEIQQALADGAYDRAAETAEKRLGMTSLVAHGAHDVAKFMPEGMQTIGSEMHRSASRFSVAVADTGATGNARPALAALARLTQQCVACHAAYRMK